MSIYPAKFMTYFSKYGAEAINLIVERHHLSEQKRSLFSVRFELTKAGHQEEADKMTYGMQLVDEEIEEIDQNIKKYGINDKERADIIRTIKKTYPNGEWLSGF